jgi:hypothetical protein
MEVPFKKRVPLLAVRNIGKPNLRNIISLIIYIEVVAYA